MAQAGSMAPAPSSWKRYIVSGEEFSVIMPTVPALSTYKDVVERLQKERRRRLIGAYADGVVYGVSCYENPSPRESLDKFISEEVRSSGWDRATDQEVLQNGVTGKQFRSTSTVGGTLQAFATKRGIYMFEVFGAPAEDARVKQFFASISLGEKVQGIEVPEGIGVLLAPAPESEPTGEVKIHVGRETDKKAVLVMKPEPIYTEAARRNLVAGTVVLKVVFSSAGSITNIRTVAGMPDGLTEQAIEVAKKIKFIPAVKDGKFVSMWMQLEYNFNLY